MAAGPQNEVTRPMGRVMFAMMARKG